MCQSILLCICRRIIPRRNSMKKSSVKIFSIVMAAILLITTVAGVIASVVS